MGNMIECMALNCNMKDKINENDSRIYKVNQKDKIEDEMNYLEMKDDMTDSYKHYEDNSVIMADIPNISI